MLAKKQSGQPLAAAKKVARRNVVNLMDALRESQIIRQAGAPTVKSGKAAKKIAKRTP